MRNPFGTLTLRNAIVLLLTAVIVVKYQYIQDLSVGEVQKRSTWKLINRKDKIAMNKNPEHVEKIGEFAKDIASDYYFSFIKVPRKESVPQILFLAGVTHESTETDRKDVDSLTSKINNLIQEHYKEKLK